MLHLAKYTRHCLDWPPLQTPYDHLQVIADGAKWGLHWIFKGTIDGQKGTRGQEYIDVQRLEGAQALCNTYTGAPQIYISAQRFGQSKSGQGRFGQRQVDNLSSINHIVIDIDTSHDQSSPPTPSQIDADFQLAVSRLESAGVPLPSFVVVTGRGLQLWWLHSLLPRQASQRWTRVVKELGRRLKGTAENSSAQNQLNVDLSASINLAGVYRLVGTRNVLARDDLQLTTGHWIAGPERYSFESIAQAVSPRSRYTFPTGIASNRPNDNASYCQHEGESSTACAERPTKKHDGVSRIELIDRLIERAINKNKSFDELLADVPIEQISRGCRKYVRILFDLRLIARSCVLGGIPAGHRDQFLWVLTVALTHLLPVDVVESTLVARARQHGVHLTEAEIAHYMGATLRRAHQAAQGIKAVHGGREVDMRYRPDRQNVYRRLQDLISMLASQQMLDKGRLTFIVERGRSAELDATRRTWRDKKRSRAGKGELLRDAYCERACTRRDEARSLRAAGMAIKDIAQQLCVAVRTVYEYLRDQVARVLGAAAGQGPTTPAQGKSHLTTQPVDKLSTDFEQISEVQSRGVNSKGRSPGEAPEPFQRSQKRDAQRQSTCSEVGENARSPREPLEADSAGGQAYDETRWIEPAPGVGIAAGEAGPPSVAGMVVTPEPGHGAQQSLPGAISRQPRAKQLQPRARQVGAAAGVANGLKPAKAKQSSRAADGQPVKRRAFTQEVLAKWKNAHIGQFLDKWDMALCLHVRSDASFVPAHNSDTQRFHVGTNRFDFELVTTGAKWFDTRAAKGGAGAIDLLMHLLDLSFVDAVKQLEALATLLW